MAEKDRYGDGDRIGLADGLDFNLLAEGKKDGRIEKWTRKNK